MDFICTFINFGNFRITKILFYSIAMGNAFISHPLDALASHFISNISSIKFTINEYFYKTNLFIALLFMAILSIIILIVISINRYRQNKIKKELALESKINELRLNGMLSQMNPHFLFNILSKRQDCINLSSALS